MPRTTIEAIVPKEILPLFLSAKGERVVMALIKFLPAQNQQKFCGYSLEYILPTL
ncbi:MAG: hypothetical protein LBH91_00990 [Prevotellaceae bacterium]|jgi:hypothetical protein|nr:hypothetical protein [Prevotellaceae bacterium]